MPYDGFVPNDFSIFDPKLLDPFIAKRHTGYRLISIEADGRRACSDKRKNGRYYLFD